MKLFLTFLLILTSLHSAISEFKSDDYQLTIGKDFDDEALDIVEDYDKNISVVGYTQDYKTTSTPTQSYTNAFEYLHDLQSTYGEQLRLIKLDQSATIVNDINFKLSQYNRGTNVIKTAQNGYLLGGYTHNGKMLISSLDALGNQHYLKEFGTANFDKLYGFIALDDGSIVAIGTSQTSRNPQDNIFVQGMGDTDVYLVKYTKDARIRWKKKYGTTGQDTGLDATPTHDGGFILLSLSNDEKESILSVTKINDTGDMLWKKVFPKAGRNKGFKIIQTIQNDYIISASFENKNAQDNIRLIKINNLGNTIWDKSVYQNAHEHLNDICVDYKGNIIGVGNTQLSSQSDTDALVRYYDANANMIWERKFGKSRQDSFSTLALLHDNSFAIAGFTTSFENKAKQIWLMKLNDDGSMAKKKIKEYADLYEALKRLFESNRHVHVHKDLRITHDGLIFAQGSSELTNEHKRVLEGFMPSLLKILKEYKSQIKNLQINGHTSTEWNAPQTQRYLNNAHLSNDRALSILDYSYQLKSVEPHRQWLSHVLSTDGYSYSNLIYADKEENKIRSRRVEFEIELN